MKILTLIGTTLAGKTTHGKRLAAEHDALYISSGSIARSLMDESTKANFSGGGLSPHDEKIRNVIESMIADHEMRCRYRDVEPIVILDGFPRTALHAAVIEGWYQENWPGQYPCACHLDVPFEVILERLKGRGRDEFDTPEIAAKRHEVFLTETYPVFHEMDRSKWLKFAVKLKLETPIPEVYDYVNRVCTTYLSGATIVK